MQSGPAPAGAEMSSTTSERSHESELKTVTAASAPPGVWPERSIWPASHACAAPSIESAAARAAAHLPAYTWSAKSGDASFSSHGGRSWPLGTGSALMPWSARLMLSQAASSAAAGYESKAPSSTQRKAAKASAAGSRRPASR